MSTPGASGSARTFCIRCKRYGSRSGRGRIAERPEKGSALRFQHGPALRPPLVSTLRLRRLVSFGPLRPPPAAHDEPPLAAVGFDARGGAPRRLPEIEDRRAEACRQAKANPDVLTRRPKGGVLTSGGVSRSALPVRVRAPF